MKLLQKLTKEQIAPFFGRWEELQADIAALHKKRDKETAERMLEGIRLYKRLLDHCGQTFEPLNSAERLAFIEQNPAIYAAFRQLDELFSEMKKLIASKRIQLKRLKNE